MLRYLSMVGLLLLSLAAVVWVVICIVSARARQKRLGLAKQFLLTAIVGTPVVGYLVLLISMSWPPDWVERRSQRTLLQARVEAAGGWDRIREACGQLVEQNDVVQWKGRRTNNLVELPAPLAALEPETVTYYPPAILSQLKEAHQIPVVRIKLFGMPSTGGNASPYLGLEVVCDPGATDYRPSPAIGAPGNRHTMYRKVAEAIYEVY